MLLVICPQINSLSSMPKVILSYRANDTPFWLLRNYYHCPETNASNSNKCRPESQQFRPEPNWKNVYGFLAWSDLAQFYKKFSSVWLKLFCSNCWSKPQKWCSSPSTKTPLLMTVLLNLWACSPLILIIFSYCYIFPLSSLINRKSIIFNKCFRYRNMAKFLNVW